MADTTEPTRPRDPEHGTEWSERWCLVCSRWIPSKAFSPHEDIHKPTKKPSVKGKRTSGGNVRSMPAVTDGDLTI